MFGQDSRAVGHKSKNWSSIFALFIAFVFAVAMSVGSGATASAEEPASTETGDGAAVPGADVAAETTVAPTPPVTDVAVVDAPMPSSDPPVEMVPTEVTLPVQPAPDTTGPSGSEMLVADSLVAPLVVPGEITSATGPLTSIKITPDLNCAVNYITDTEGEFFDDTACGTFIATGGSLFGPAVVPAGSSATGTSGYVPLTPVSQTGAGTGTSIDPYKLTTIADAGTLRITQTDSYVEGQESYRTDTKITNNGLTTVTIVLYKAADCYLQNSDNGYGAYDPTTGAVSCVAEAEGGGRGVRIEQFYPLSPGSSYIQDGYSEVWTAVGTQAPFPSTCTTCDTAIDNGAGLSWRFDLDPGATATRSHLTTFSPLGISPLSTTKTADSPTTAAGGSNGYTVTFNNPNQTAITVNSIVDTLPAGFTYVPGSSSGATTADPTIVGNVLTWTGSFSVPATGSVSVRFGVRVAGTPGEYFNSAGGSADTVAIAGADNTARVVVTGVAPVVPPTVVVPPAAVVPPAVTPAAPSGALPATGTATLPLLGLSALMLALGIGLVGLGRRRHIEV